MKIVGIHQPNFIPWLGFFNKVYNCDTFILLDDVQFSKGSYTNRCKILNTENKESWITLPINYSFGDKINQIKLSNSNWKAILIQQIEHFFSNKPEFEKNWPEIKKEILSMDEYNLSKINLRLIVFMLKKMDIKTKIIFSSDFNLKLKSTELLIKLIKKVSDESIYLSGSGAKKYQDENLFQKSKIKIIYQNYISPEYHQINQKNFYPGLSILDAIFNVGWEKTKNLVKIKVSEK